MLIKKTRLQDHTIIRYCRSVVEYLFVLLMMISCHEEKVVKKTPQYVKTTIAESTGEESMISYPGKTKAADVVSPSFKVSGTLSKIYVKEGDHVRKGQLIAELDAHDYEVQLRATEAEYAQIKADAERVISMYNEGTATASNYDKARYGLKQIEEKLAHHRDEVKYCKLYSPIDGYVQGKNHDVGENVVYFKRAGELRKIDAREEREDRFGRFAKVRRHRRFAIPDDAFVLNFDLYRLGRRARYARDAKRVTEGEKVGAERQIQFARFAAGRRGLVGVGNIRSGSGVQAGAERGSDRAAEESAAISHNRFLVNNMGISRGTAREISAILPSEIDCL